MAEFRAIFVRLVNGLKPDEDAGLDSTYRRIGRRQRRRRVSAAALAVVIAAGGLGVGAVAILKVKRIPAVPSANGMIAFEVDVISPDAQSSEVYVVNPDGSGLRRLTSGSVNFGDPAWSPDGTTLAVDGQYSTQGGIYLLDDGTHVRQITSCGPTSCRDIGPSWSPDGHQLAFQRFNGTSKLIVVANADGSNPRSLPCPPTLCPFSPPVWSPDGQWLVFAPCCRLGPVARDYEVPLYEMHPDGTGLRRLWPDLCPPQCHSDGSPAWSPDGRTIAFSRQGAHSGVDIYVMRADGSDVGQLTHCQATPCVNNYEPTWSPDGHRIAFIHDESSPGHVNETLEVMNADGSDVRVVARLPGLMICCPSWSRRGVATPEPTPAETPSTSPSQPPPTKCQSGWVITKGPLIGEDTEELLARVGGSSGTDVWSVGSRYVQGSQGPYPLVTHWDGAGWNASSGADLGGSKAALSAVAALSPDDVWVVGRTEGNREEPLVEHWDGLAWGVVPSPAIGGPANIGRGLVAISALGPADVWALGYYQPGVGGESISRDVFEHWDGQRWSIVASPPPISGSGTTAMQDLAAAEPARAWAVGGMISGFGEAGAPSGALVEHWDGTTWAQAPAPTGAAPLLQVAAVGNEVWAVRGGGSFRSVGSYGSTIEGSQVLQFDGVSWTTTLSQPNVAIADITAVSAADVWVVGTQGRAPFLARWNGKAWVEPPLAGAGSTEGPPGTPYLDAVTHAGSAVVAVGSQYAYGFPPETRLWILCGG